MNRLGSPGIFIGAFPTACYSDSSVTLDPGSKLFVYSDGCYEVTSSTTGMMTLAEFGDILAGSSQQPDQLDTVVNAVQIWQQRPEFEDDFSLVMLRM